MIAKNCCKIFSGLVEFAHARRTNATHLLGWGFQEAALRISHRRSEKNCYALEGAQGGETPDKTKPLQGFSGVYEIVRDYARDTYRAVYVANLGDLIYVLHCFQKKSKRGIKTPKKEN